MKSFKRFLQERASLSTKTYIFSIKDIPLSQNMLNRIFGNNEKITCFHVTGDGIFDLVKIQGSRKSISTFNRLGSLSIFGGVSSGNGFMVELEGNVLIKSFRDLFSGMDTQGRRWINIDRLSGFTTIENEYDEIPKIVWNNHKDKMDGEYSGVKWSKLEKLEDKKLKASLIKDYFDEVEKFIIKHKDYFRHAFFDYAMEQSPNTWNEIIVNNIKIKEVWIYDVNEDTKKFMKNRKKYKFKVKNLVDFNSREDERNKLMKNRLKAMFNHVKRVG